MGDPGNIFRQQTGADRVTLPAEGTRGLIRNTRHVLHNVRGEAGVGHIEGQLASDQPERRSLEVHLGYECESRSIVGPNGKPDSNMPEPGEPNTKGDQHGESFERLPIGRQGLGAEGENLPLYGGNWRAKIPCYHAVEIQGTAQASVAAVFPPAG